MRGPRAHIYIHCVWATWDRQPLVLPSFESRIYAAIQAKCLQLKCAMIAIGGDLDHVHLLARLPPSLAVSTLVGETKGASSHLMNHDVAPNREFKWQGAYGVLSVSPHSLPTVIDYIKTQKERHANRRTFDEWEKCYEE